MIKVAINGFGRIGRLVFRAAIVSDDIEVVAINAPDKTTAQLAYTVKYDSVHGRFNGTVESDDSAIIVNGKRVPVVGNRNPAELPWGEMGVEYVLECTGAFPPPRKHRLTLTQVLRSSFSPAPPRTTPRCSSAVSILTATPPT